MFLPKHEVGATVDPLHPVDVIGQMSFANNRPGSKGSATVVAFGILSADGQGREKKIQFPASSFGPAGCP